ncbi:iron-containing alcohol dehydrogenase [Myxococcota bacterium]
MFQKFKMLRRTSGFSPPGNSSYRSIGRNLIPRGVLASICGRTRNRKASVEPFVHFAPTRVIAGQGSLDRLAEEVGAFGRKCLIASGRRSARLSGLLGRVTDLLASKKVEYALFDQVEPNPTTGTIQDGADMARSEKIRWVLGIGGGSALDAAKAIALMAVNQGDVRSYCAGMRPENPPFPVVAIPTTSGTVRDQKL